MIYSRRFIPLLFSIATFLQLSPTIAANQACVNAILAYPTTASIDYSALKSLVNGQCAGKNTCSVDLSSWSTNGLSVEDFEDECNAAGGIPNNLVDDFVITCPSLTSRFLNIKLCIPDNCNNYSDAEDASVQMLKKGDIEYCSDINNSLPTGSIIGIVVGLVLACGGCAFYFVRRAKSRGVPTE
jgi:hypothetical protein